MAYELRDGQGNLFRNDKGDNASRPDYRGEINIEGRVYQLAAWIKEGKKGKFMSLNAQPKEERREQRQEPSRGASDPNDEIPFMRRETD